MAAQFKTYLDASAAALVALSGRVDSLVLWNLLLTAGLVVLAFREMTRRKE